MVSSCLELLTDICKTLPLCFQSSDKQNQECNSFDDTLNFFLNYLPLLSGLDPSPPETSGSSATDFRGKRIGLFSAQILKQRLKIGRNKTLCHESRQRVARWQLFRVMQTNLVYSIQIFEGKKYEEYYYHLPKCQIGAFQILIWFQEKQNLYQHCHCSRKHLSLAFQDNLTTSHRVLGR